MNGHEDYDCYVHEAHHKHKIDAPSGTGLSLANDVIAELDRKSKTVSSELANRAPEKDELSISWTRAGEIIGEHKVTYTSPIDELSISHRAFNRKGFALGAVLGAEWLVNHKGFHNFSDIFE